MKDTPQRSSDRPALVVLGVVLISGLAAAIWIAERAPPRAHPNVTEGGASSSAAPGQPALPPSASVVHASSSAPSADPTASSSGPMIISESPGQFYPVASVSLGPEEKLTPEEELKRKKRAIELLTETITRVEEDLAKAQSAGDEKAAHTAKIRLQRLRDVLAKRKAELSVPLDAGG